MNKPIFQKIKRSNQSLRQSPNSKSVIQNISVQDMQKTLLTHINTLGNSSSQNNVTNTLTHTINYSNNLSPLANSNNSQQKSYYPQYNKSIDTRNNSNQKKKVPELIMQNDQLKFQIQKLKNQKNLIFSQYQTLSSFNKNLLQYQNFQETKNKDKQYQKDKAYELKDKKQYEQQRKENEREFSFRKSVQNAQKLISSQSNEQQYQKPIKSNIYRQKPFGSINDRNIPSSDSNKNSRQSQRRQQKEAQKRKQRRQGLSLQSKGNFSYGLKSRSKQTYSTLQERFYQYCKSQMIRMNNQNTKLTLKIGQLQHKITTLHRQNQLLQQKNEHFRVINQQLQQKLKTQNQKIQKINQRMQITITKKDQLVQNQYKEFQRQIKQLKLQQQKLLAIIKQKDLQISKLIAENNRRQVQSKNYGELVAKNVALQNQINQVIIRNKKLSDKFRRMPVIDHLWEIKEVQYQNIMNLISSNQKELQALQKSKNIQKSNKSPRRSTLNPFDLTFSKQQTYF